MTAKKRWFSKAYSSESLEGGQSDPDISWTISDSETELSPKTPPPKKRKRLPRKKSPTWINFLNNSSPRRSPEDPSFHFLESPVITRINLDEQSPVLTQRSDTFSKEQSPVIGRRDILRKIKDRNRKEGIIGIIHDDTSNLPGLNLEETVEKIHDISRNSPEIFPSQSLVTDSQSSTTKESPVKISPSKSQTTQAWKIDPFPTQHSSPVVVDSASFSPSNSDPQSQLYHQPLRKKRFKKGGLAWQLMKAQLVQKNSLAIWQHELYLNQPKGAPLKRDQSELSFQFTVVKEFKEYGCTVVECEYVKRPPDILPPETGSSFLLVNPSISLVAGVTYSVFPPYNSRIVGRRDREIRCIFNTPKICISERKKVR